MINNINLHAGHRARFREQILNTEPYNLSDLHFLEYLLTFSIPRIDTNPIAHALLAEFKTIDRVFEAGTDALMSIDGVGEKTARFLQSMSTVCYVYNRAKALEKPYVGTLNNVLDFIHKILPQSTNEQFIILIVGKNFEVKSYKIFTGISHSYINFDTKVLTEYLYKHKTSFCIMAHTHPEHSALPSISDNQAFETMAPLLKALSIQLLDNIILGENDVYSYKLNSIRFYNEIDCDFMSNHKYDLKSVTNNSN